MDQNKIRNYILTFLSGCAVVCFMSFLQNKGLDPYYVKILQYWAIYIIFGASFQLIYGYSGLLSLGHAGLIAVGAYVVALCTIPERVKSMSFLLSAPAPFIQNLSLPFIPALLLAGIVTAFIGFLIAAPALRLGGDYLAMVTLGFAEVIRLVLVNVPSVFNGALGLRSIPHSASLALIWAIAIVTMFVLKRIEMSSYGRAFLAINEDEIGSEALGISVFKNKILSFVISSFFAGIGGGLLASLLGTVDPNTFKSTLSYASVSIVVLGGLCSMTGVVLASGIYTISSEFLRILETPSTVFGVELPGIPGMRVLCFAAMLILLMLYRREGLLGSWEFSWNWFFGLFKKKKPKNDEMGGEA